VHPGETSVAAGLQDLTEANGFKLIDSQGRAALYQVVGCG
jgi:hypothetical protein